MQTDYSKRRGLPGCGIEEVRPVRKAPAPATALAPLPSLWPGDMGCDPALLEPSPPPVKRDAPRTPAPLPPMLPPVDGCGAEADELPSGCPATGRSGPLVDRPLVCPALLDACGAP